MKCAIFERIPPTQRDILNQESAKFLETIEFLDKGLYYENVNEIHRLMLLRGAKLATTVNKTQHTDYDFVIYVEPNPASSPREAAIKASMSGPGKPVSIGGPNGIRRRLPLPENRRR